jgi:hypothetical protein
MPAHAHSITDSGHRHTTAVRADSNSLGNGAAVTGVTGSSYNSGGGAYTDTVGTGISIQNNGSGGSHNHTFTATAHAHTFTGTAINMAVNYVDFILATAN